MKKILLFLLLFPVFTVFSQNADIDILRDINLNRNRQLDGFYRGITNSAAPVAIGTPIILYGISLLNKDSLNNQKAIYIGVSVISSVAIATILKYGVNRTRPFVTYPYLEKESDGGSPSFPSGHTSEAFALATSLSMAYPKWYVIAPSFAWAGAVGYSRMDLGVHYPSDVLAGALLGSASAYLCYKANEWIRQNKKKKLKLSQNNF
jgi:membrane-associated phospholipid phosphatase